MGRVQFRPRIRPLDFEEKSPLDQRNDPVAPMVKGVVLLNNTKTYDLAPCIYEVLKSI
jgi:hypothetical protein